MLGHTNQKWWHQFEETFDVYLHAKSQLHHSRFVWDIAKILQTCYFGYFEHVWLCRYQKKNYQLVKNFRVYLQAKNQLHLPCLIFLEILQRYANFFFRVLWAILAMNSKKIIQSTCRKLRCLSACQEINFIIHFFFEILHSRESCNLIDQQHFES